MPLDRQVHTHVTSTKPTMRDGFVALLPLWLATAPFGALYAMQARLAGLSLLETQAMSLFVFAGASQFTAVTLLYGGAGVLSIIITTLIVNLRHMLLAASIAPYLENASLLRRALLAFQLTDESYALSIRRFQEGTGSTAYLLGTNLSMYVCWQMSTGLGFLLGEAVPDPARYGLDLIFPLTFLGLLMPMVRSRPAWATVISATALALLGRAMLPGYWYLLVAGIGGSLVGALLETPPSQPEGAATMLSGDNA
jgi:4-azaleucine resistance transporter AzlC